MEEAVWVLGRISCSGRKWQLDLLSSFVVRAMCSFDCGGNSASDKVVLGSLCSLV